MSETPELLPCPFCGGEAVLIDFVGSNCFVRCTVCRADSDDMSAEKTIAAWNRRVSPTQTEEK